MSVIVKNMDMPKSCSNCRFYDDDHDYPTCIVTGYSRGYNWSPFNQRMPDCPLVEVEEPHGRLVDADKLSNDGWVLHKEVIRMGGYAIHELPLKNETIPTIIPATQRR